MPNTVLTTLDAVKEEVETRLGGQRIEVELDNKDVKSSLDHALREYARHVPGWGWSQLAAIPAQKRYRVDTVVAGFKGVVNVQFITRRTEPSAIDPFDPYDTILGGLLVGDETFGDIDQRLMYLEDAARIVSAEPEWRGQWERVETAPASGIWQDEYALYVDVVRSETLTAFRFTYGYSSDPAAQNAMSTIPDGDVDWLLNWTVARAKRILAKIRGKFGGIPNPEGGQDDIDATGLQQEAEAEELALTDEIKLRRPPLAPVIE